MMFDYLRGLGRGRSTRAALLAGFVMALVGSTLALAEEHEPAPATDDPAPATEDAAPTVETESSDPAPVEGRPEDGAIVFSLPDDHGDFTDCSGATVADAAEAANLDAEGEAVTEGAEVTVTDGEEAAAAEGTELTTDVEGCLAVSALGPNDQWNHGQAVRAYVHALQTLEFDGPPGHLVRNAARSDIGKEVDDGDGLLEPATESTSASSRTGKKGTRSNGNGNGKAKGRR